MTMPPPLPPPIITSSFSSNHDEDNMEDDAVEVALKRKVVKSNARKLMKKFILSQKFSTHCFSMKRKKKVAQDQTLLQFWFETFLMYVSVRAVHLQKFHHRLIGHK